MSFVVEYNENNKLNGLFYRWRNEGKNLNDYVNITASSSSSTSRLPTNLLDQTTSYWRSGSSDTHWIIIQLLKNSLSLSRYSFWQFDTGAGNIVKSWIFEGSQIGRAHV